MSIIDMSFQVNRNKAGEEERKEAKRRAQLLRDMAIGEENYNKNRHHIVAKKIAETEQRAIAPFDSIDEYQDAILLAGKIGFSYYYPPKGTALYKDVEPYLKAYAELKMEVTNAFHPFPNVEALNATVAAAIRAHSQLDTHYIRNLSDLYLLSVPLRESHSVVFGEGEPEATLTPEATFIAALLDAGVTQDFAPFNDAQHLEQAVAEMRKNSIFIKLNIINSFQTFYSLISALLSVKPSGVNNLNDFIFSITEPESRRKNLSALVYSMVAVD